MHLLPVLLGINLEFRHAYNIRFELELWILSVFQFNDGHCSSVLDLSSYNRLIFREQRVKTCESIFERCLGHQNLHSDQLHLVFLFGFKVRPIIDHNSVLKYFTHQLAWYPFADLEVLTSIIFKFVSFWWLAYRTHDKITYQEFFRNLNFWSNFVFIVQWVVDRHIFVQF